MEQQNATKFFEQTVEFSTIETIDQVISSVKDSDVLVVKFKFDPFEQNILMRYLPDGYITINGEYDVLELMLKTFFRPIVAHNRIKFLILDLNSFMQSDHQKNRMSIKNLLERMDTDFARRKYKTMLGLKFKYNTSTKEFIDSLFNYTVIATRIKAIQIDSGYENLMSQKSYQSYARQWEYFSLENNLIGAQNTQFPYFVESLKNLKKLKILNLKHNAIGSFDKQLKLLSAQIVKMTKLEYISLENNLIGAFPKDSEEFRNFTQKNKTLTVNIRANCFVAESSNECH